MSSFLQTGTRTLELELVMLSSAHHVEMNPSDAGFQDRYVVQEVIKEMAKNRPIDAKGKRAFKGWCYFPLLYGAIVTSSWLVHKGGAY
jgi:hypothetical protein